MENTNELEVRQKDFLERYGKLVEETKMDLAVYPVFIPDEKGAFKIICQSTPVDITNQPTKSPFITQ